MMVSRTMEAVGGRQSCPTEDEILAFLDGKLPANQVASLTLHLDSCERCRQSVTAALDAGSAGAVAPTFEPTASFRPQRVARPGPPPRTFRPGQMVAERYRLTGFLGAGGMGEVYAAEDIVVGGKVALKTLTGEVADNPDALLRMKREVQLARLITHPNVCRVYDFGIHRQNGQPSGTVAFLTMELVAGSSLGQKIRRTGPMGSAEVAVLVDQMIAAIEAAHDVGVTHRDFKSDNVLLAAGKNGPRAVVTDFGLASCALTPQSDRLTMESRVMMGTPAYMAPEQVDSATVTPAVDYYALGIVIFEMLTGALPFSGSSPMAVAARRLVEPAPPLRKHIRDIDERWEELVSGCLKRDPQERQAFSSLQLRPILRDILAHGASRSQKRSVRRRALGAALAGCLILSGGLVVKRGLGKGRASATWSHEALSTVDALPGSAPGASVRTTPVEPQLEDPRTVDTTVPKPTDSFGAPTPTRKRRPGGGKAQAPSLPADDEVIDAFGTSRRR